MAKGPRIASETTEYLDPGEVLRGWERRTKERPIGLLVAEARRRGYEPGTTVEDVLCLKKTVRAEEDIRPPKGSTEAPVRDVSLEWYVHSFTNTKRGSKNRAGIMAITVQAGSNIQRYEMFSEAPSGNWNKAREFKVKGNAVVPAHSWLSRWVTCIASVCPGKCVDAFWRCYYTVTSPSISNLMKCVLRLNLCVACVPWCAACVTCDCHWTCKWAFGCSCR